MAQSIYKNLNVTVITTETSHSPALSFIQSRGLGLNKQSTDVFPSSHPSCFIVLEVRKDSIASKDR